MKLLIILGIFIVLAGGALAHGWMQTHFDTYDELEEYREETNYNIMPWIENEEDFEHYERMHHHNYRMWRNCW